MEIEFTEEILKYCYEENRGYRGFLTSFEEILMPYILKNHKKSLKEYIELDNIELIIGVGDRITEIKVFNTYEAIKISKEALRNIEEELIQPLYNSLKDLNLEYILKIGCYLYIDVKGESIFTGAWKELMISRCDYKVRFVCPSLDIRY